MGRPIERPCRDTGFGRPCGRKQCTHCEKSPQQGISYGFYTTFNPQAGQITDENKVIAGDDNTWEHHFSKLDQPLFLLDAAILKQKLKGFRLPGRYRLLVYGLADNQFFDGSLPDDFDYVFHIRQTSGNHSFYLK